MFAHKLDFAIAFSKRGVLKTLRMKKENKYK